MCYIIEDVRCAGTIPGTILVEFGIFRACVVLLRMSGALKVYLVILDETTVMYIGFDSISLRRLPTDSRARALVLAALVLIFEKSVYEVLC